MYARKQVQSPQEKALIFVQIVNRNARILVLYCNYSNGNGAESPDRRRKEYDR
nr:MAG TPA: hypothetical protein [Caudoviricetes sp.]